MTVPALGTAFGAGILSFLSPCVLPLIPGYLSFISGYSLADIRSGKGRLRVVAGTAAFVAGFTAVFIALGLVFSGASSLLGGLGRTLTIVAGLLVMALGLNTIFDLVKVLNFEARFHPKAAAGRTDARSPASRRGLAGAFLLGLAFAAGWSPCVGPILASILLFASREGDASRSALLLGAYSLGLALPFLAVGLFFERLTPLMAWFKRHARGVRIASGLVLVILGAAMAAGRLGAVSSIAVRAGLAMKETLVRSPGPARAVGSALWALLAAATLAIPAIGRRRVFTKPRIVFASIFALAAAAEAAGLWSTAALLSEWLLFAGG
jgi:cytochrome c-type biogenesis protein